MSIIGNPLVTTNYISDSFSGDASTVAFTLSQAPASAASIAVYISGLYQIPTSAYSISGTTLTFTGAPPTGTNNITVLHLGVKSATLVPVNASVTPAMLNNANVIYWSASNNNIGIGNTTPTSLLTVTGTAALGNTTFAGTITANGSVGTAGQVLTSGATGNAYWSTVSNTLDGVLGSGNTTTKSLTTGTLTVNGAFTTTTNTATIGTTFYSVANGNVGIGTAAPSTKLIVSGSSGTGVVEARVSGGGNGGDYGILSVATSTTVRGRLVSDAGSGDFRIDTAGSAGGILFMTGAGYSNAMYVSNTGNIGIGTSSPDIYGFGGRLLGIQGGSSYTNLLLAGDTNSGIAFGSSTARVGQITVDSTNGIQLFAQGTGNTLSALIDRSGNFRFNSGFGGVATAYGVRAWVNFNGTGTVAIRSSGNVSSITDNGSGDYTVNFTSAMPDGNYTMAGSFEGQSSPGSLFPAALSGGTGTAVTLVSTTQYRMRTEGPTDATFISAIFVR